MLICSCMVAVVPDNPMLLTKYTTGYVNQDTAVSIIERGTSQNGAVVSVLAADNLEKTSTCSSGTVMSQST